jgi:hypothetical protein
MIFRISGRSVHADLTAIAIRMRAKKAPPMTHMPQSPTYCLGMADRVFNRFVRMTGARH